MLPSSGKAGTHIEWFKWNRSGQIFQDQLVLDVCQPRFCKKQVALDAEAVSANL